MSNLKTSQYLDMGGQFMSVPAARAAAERVLKGEIDLQILRYTTTCRKGYTVRRQIRRDLGCHTKDIEIINPGSKDERMA